MSAIPPDQPETYAELCQSMQSWVLHLLPPRDLVIPPGTSPEGELTLLRNRVIELTALARQAHLDCKLLGAQIAACLCLTELLWERAHAHLPEDERPDWVTMRDGMRAGAFERLRDEAKATAIAQRAPQLLVPS